MLELAPFQNILFKILPLYLVILLGYIAGRFLEIERKSISLMIMYVVAPIVFFNGIIKDMLAVLIRLSEKDLFEFLYNHT